MKRLAFCFALFAMSMSAMAQSAALNPVENPAVAPVSEPTATAQSASRDQAARNEVTDRNCLKETGSRLAPRPDNKGRKCVNASGRAYSREDLDRTGAIDLSDALRRLDPAVH